MPTYDYECDACGHKQEIFQNISEPLLEKCPKCKKKKFRRLFGAGAAVIFKGSGFYTTDYRPESYTKAASADKPSDPGGSSTSDSSSTPAKSEANKSEPTKPAAKSESTGNSSSTSSGKPSKKKD